MGLEAIDKKTAKAWVRGAAKLEKADAKAAEPAGTAPADDGAEGAAKPRLQIGGLRHDPVSFKKGEPVTSTVTVTNNGDKELKVKLSLYVNEALADATTVAAKAGKSKDASFKWTAQERNKLNIRGELVK